MPCSCARFALFAGMVKTIREDLAKVFRMPRNGMDLGIAWRQRHAAGADVGTLNNAQRGYGEWLAPQTATPAPAATPSQPPKPATRSSVRPNERTGRPSAQHLQGRRMPVEWSLEWGSLTTLTSAHIHKACIVAFVFVRYVVIIKESIVRYVRRAVSMPHAVEHANRRCRAV